MSKLIHIDAAYKEWIQALSKRYRQSQIKAAVQVNREMLAYYHKIVPQVEGQIKEAILPQVGAEIPVLISAVPWGHHKYIMDKCQNDVNKALFYVRQTVENGWSRAMLLNWLESDLYERQGKALTNFSATLPAETSDLAREITKDPYNFAFAGVTGKYNEAKMKEALLRNMTDFLVEWEPDSHM